jgi:hypothetical protein
MSEYIIKHRRGAVYVAAEGGFHHDLASARHFSTPQAADDYRRRSVIPDASFVICELTGDGRVVPRDGLMQA